MSVWLSISLPSFSFDFWLQGLAGESSKDIRREGVALRSGRAGCRGEGGAEEKMEVSVCFVDFRVRTSMVLKWKLSLRVFSGLVG